MADPVIVVCTANAWTLVAQNVIAGQIWKTKTGPFYHQTYVMTGNPAPTGLTKAADFQGDVMDISAQAAIDVYLYAQGEAGEIRADL